LAAEDKEPCDVDERQNDGEKNMNQVAAGEDKRRDQQRVTNRLENLLRGLSSQQQR
jgi:hypothetical protein